MKIPLKDKHLKFIPVELKWEKDMRLVINEMLYI